MRRISEVGGRPASSSSHSGIDIASIRSNSASLASPAVTASSIFAATGMNSATSVASGTAAPPKKNTSCARPAVSSSRSSSVKP